MWQEARRQERAIRSAMVNYKKRAERRRDYYEKIKQDPIKFLRLYGRPSKIHYDNETALAAENPRNMVPWIGDKAIIIDRFDARSNLDIVEVNPSRTAKPTLSREAQIEERMCNYERYRCLVQNEFAAISEEMVLRQIEIEEKFGSEEETKKRKEEEEKKKKLGTTKAAIGYVYDDSTEFPPAGPSTDQDDEESEADSDMDIDVEIDLEELTDEHRRLLTKVSTGFGMRSGDFLRLLRRDKEVEEEVRRAKQLEEEKAQFSGKKSRRERRILKEQRLRDKHMKQPPKFNPGALGSMYTTSDNPFDGVLSSASSSGSSRSGSPTPPRSGPQFITSFGAGDDGEESCGEAPVGPQLPSPRGLAPSFAARKRAWRRQDEEERLLAAWRAPPPRTRSRSRSSEASGRGRGSNRRRGNSQSRSPERRRGISRSPERRRANSRSRSIERRRGNSRSRSPERRRANSRSPERRRDNSRSRSPERRRANSRSPDRRRSSSRSQERRRAIHRDTRRSSDSRSLSRSPSRRANRIPWRPLGRARSRSSSASRRETRRRRSRSDSDAREPTKAPSGPVVVKRYYRPELEESSASASESDVASEQELSAPERYNQDPRNPPSGNQAGRAVNKATSQKMTPQEMLRLKMQLALSKTHLADKKAEKEKMEKMEKERKDRDEEMRQLVLLRRQRERRKREMEGVGRRRDAPAGGYTGGFRSSSSSSSSSSSRRRSSSEESERRRRHSRSPKARRFDTNCRSRHRSPPSSERPPSRALLRDPPGRPRACQPGHRQDRYPTSGHRQDRYQGSNARQEKYAASDNRQERYPASNNKQEKYLGSNSRQERYPASDNRQERYPASDSRQERYPALDNRQERYPASDNRQERYPASDNRQERYPASDNRQERYPASDNRQERYPASDNRQERYPTSDNRQERYPASDNRQERYPASDNRQERYPASDSRRRFENYAMQSRRTNDRDFANYGRR